MSVGNKGGRPRKPIALHQRDGTYRKDRMGDRKEPPYPDGLPPPPAHLDAVAKRRYLEVGTVMLEARVLTVADAGLLAMYADSWSNWIAAVAEARRELKRQAALEKKWNGIADMDDAQEALEQRIRKLERRALGEHPAVRRAQEEKKLIERFGSQLGLSPVMRGKVQQVEPEPDKPTGLAEFLA